MRKFRIFLVLIALFACVVLGFLWIVSKSNTTQTINIIDVSKDMGIEEMKRNLTNNEQHAHFSVDDVFDSLVNLTENDYGSIFEEDHFRFLKELHDSYDIVVSCYVFFENDDLNLTDITDKYAEEFESNADWLKFGFHSINGDFNYGKADEEKAYSDYTKVIEQLLRITGSKESIDRTVRLHNYAVSDEALEGFRKAKLGVETLLSPDDERLAYNLNVEDTSYLYNYAYFSNGDMNYLKTDIRVESVENIIGFYDEFITNDNVNNPLIIFTHEKWLLDNDIQERLHQLFKFAEDYRFRFF